MNELSEMNTVSVQGIQLIPLPSNYVYNNHHHFLFRGKEAQTGRSEELGSIKGFDKSGFGTGWDTTQHLHLDADERVLDENLVKFVCYCLFLLFLPRIKNASVLPEKTQNRCARSQAHKKCHNN